jgi:hypothetical protein
MPIFYKQAIRAGVNGDPADWIRDEHLSDWRGLAAALDLLTPEQRCDAIYADWLLQLNSPAALALLQVRNLLIGQGALAANYLAELAQNADDASDGEAAQVRIVLNGGWLLVSNNGRKVTSLNLLGLSRFFVHAAGGVVDLNEQTIGRFGIGFKSCYRIASKVFVHTWDETGHFGFRLPICREGDDESHPDSERLERLIEKLRGIGVTMLDPKVRDVKWLGYCTPEFQSELPSDLKESTSDLRRTTRGTLFCFRIRPDKLAEVHNRISGQAHEVYELCPLFLPNVRLVQLGRNELRMREIRHDAGNDLPGKVKAEKVELTTQSLGERPSNSRFWRLKGINVGDLWHIALHADSQFRLRVEQEEDEHGTTIKDGAAYAFFPLNAVTKTWPFRLHLHIKLPTNLARDDWNSDENAQVCEQINRAVAGVAGWLEQHTDKWHPEWRIESLAARKPNQNETWAWHLWNRLCAERSERKLVRSFNGNFVKASFAKAVYLVERDEAKTAWQQVLQWQSVTENRLELTPLKSGDVFPISEVSAQDVAAICKATIQQNSNEDFRHRTVLTAFLGCHNLMFHRSPGVAVDFLKVIHCHTATGAKISLSELCEQPGGAELSPDWHQTFSVIEGWSREVSWAMIPVEGRTLSEHLKRLSQPEFNPAWVELSNRLSTEEQWKHLGDQFWRTPRGRCPETVKQSALASIRVPSQSGDWLPIADLWLDDDSAVDCFCGLIKGWDRSWTDAKRKGITEKLKEWDLWESWGRSAKTLLKEKLSGILARRLAENAGGDAFSLVFDKPFDAARRHLDDGWKHILDEAEKTAVSRFVSAQMKEAEFAKKTVVSRTISDSIRAALGILPEYFSAPLWLTEVAYQRIVRLGLRAEDDFEFLSQQEFTNHQERLTRELLEKFHQWPATTVEATALIGLQQLCISASLNKRRDWLLGLGPQKSRRLRDLIVPTPATKQTTASSRLKEMLLKQAEWRGEPLPAVLAGVAALAEACVQPDKLEPEAVSGILTPLEREQLPSEMEALSEIIELLDAGGCSLFGSPRSLNLKWRYEGEIVATLDDAQFSLDADRLIIHRFRPPADEEQCRRVLTEFELHATTTSEYATDVAELSPFERYQKHRDTIRLTLLKELVAKVGYEKHHILRELLQNAESAYASKRNPPTDAWFEFAIEAAAQLGQRKVVARHVGRAFNEPDITGQARHDVARVWRLAAESERTADEVGRFNRGFKTLFTVALNGLVHIRSGDYDFEVIDLLMLKPADPQPNPAKHSPLTEFTFEAEYKHTLEMFRLEAAPRPNTVLPVVNAATFAFLAHLQRIRVKFEQRIWQWRIVRGENLEGWRQVTVTEDGAESPDRFLVFSDAGTKPMANSPHRRFAAAVRLDANSLPAPLDKLWRKFHLTFETDHDFPLDFLVNGDFDSDQGRVGLRNIARSGLVELAYDAVIQRAESEIRNKPASPVWLAWARVLHLKEAPTELEASGELRPLRRHAEKAAGRLSAIVPHDGGLVAASTLEFPSTLFRRIGGVFGQNWHINQAKWIDAEIAAALPDAEHRRITFDGWVILQQPDSPLLRLVDGGLKSETFTRLRLSGPEKDELDKAKGVLAEKLRPAAPPHPPEPEMPVVEAWSVENLWHWWERRGKPMADYTLEGDENWRLLYTTEEADTNSRRERLKTDLLSVSTENGKRIWYRLFGLACMMSAGRRMTEIRNFWRSELDRRQFWERTSKETFGEGTDALFADVTNRPFANLAASGEHAYFWRRVFYDIRKIHRLVWEDHFPATLLELVEAGRGADLLHFLKTGHLPGQKAWVGVFGQSAGAPLFFVVRELCRLGVITDPAVKPLALFVSTPVRRAMERIGWLGADIGNRVDFEALASLSDSLYNRIASDHEFGSRLQSFYDIPLLHLGLEG